MQSDDSERECRARMQSEDVERGWTPRTDTEPISMGSMDHTSVILIPYYSKYLAHDAAT